MTRTHQLEANLKTLGLSGMLDTLAARLGQAQGGDLGHLEFLEALCEDEICRRDTAAMARRLRAAHFEQTCTIEDYDFKYNPKVPAAHIRDLATLRFLDNNESIILHGPVGVGKSHVAQALGHAACRRGHNVISPKRPGCWPTWPAATPTAAGKADYGAGPARRWSSWTILP
jgi:DNA replication protein DnaC